VSLIRQVVGIKLKRLIRGQEGHFRH
jgi:hypothetical protein